MTESYTPQEKEQNKKNRRVILGIFGIPVLIIVLSTALYYLVESKAIDLGTVNNGELISPPLQFSELPLQTLSGEVFDYSKPEPKWAYVVVGDRECKDYCERMLYIARQSITALAKKMGDVRLLYVTTDNEISDELQQRVEREYRGIDVIKLSSTELSDFFVSTNIDPLQDKQFFVVDRHGWLMMRYTVSDTDQDTLNVLGKAVVKDMKRLIK